MLLIEKHLVNPDDDTNADSPVHDLIPEQGDWVQIHPNQTGMLLPIQGPAFKPLPAQFHNSLLPPPHPNILLAAFPSPLPACEFLPFTFSLLKFI